ncbi:entry exclusion protein 1 [Pectobacterium versatile]|jgi:hypothetical protein|uniref:entry exclusion protein 1 n=1 Tax=Pectobacterium versatile TaxID=2488639 RepID=UPI001F4285BA|nr:entry exclusion protein 1 [Pectobacterium versatile]
MAWVTVRQAMKLTGKARSSLYRDMAKGRVSYRSDVDGTRSIDTSELIRVYGELIHDETPSRDTLRQGGETGNAVIHELVTEIKMLRDEVAGLRVEMQEIRRLEHKPEPDLSPVSTKWWQLWRRPSK